MKNFFYSLDQIIAISDQILAIICFMIELNWLKSEKNQV